MRRDFFTAIPFTVKAGFDLRDSLRDFRGGTITYNYAGSGGRTAATPFFDPIYSQRVLPYGFPQLQTISNRKFYETEYINSRWSTRELERQIGSFLYDKDRSFTSCLRANSLSNS